MKKTFAFFITPLDAGLIKNLWPVTKVLPASLTKAAVRFFASFNGLFVKKISIVANDELQGYLIGCNVLSGQPGGVSEQAIIDKIIAASGVAYDMGAKIMGLGGYAAAVYSRSSCGPHKMKLAVTTGHALTGWSVFESIYRMARLKRIDLQKSSVAIIGAATPLGYLCSKKLSGYAQEIILTDTNGERLQALRDALLRLNSSVSVRIEEDIQEALKQARIIINAYERPALHEPINRLRSESIFCDVAIPGNGACLYPTKNAMAIKAGLIKLPFASNCGIASGIFKNIIYASLAETMLLAFEERFNNYSSGEDTNMDKLEEIADLAVRYGFEVWLPEAPAL